MPDDRVSSHFYGDGHPEHDHEYEPGETTSPMQTDPDCRICGEAKRRH